MGDGMKQPDETPIHESKCSAWVDILSRSVDELELSVRSSECLKRAKVQTIGGLLQMTEAEILRAKHGGHKSLNEINEILNGLGLQLGMSLDAQGRWVMARPMFQMQAGPGDAAPPRRAEFLLYFVLPTEDRECIPGDLAEEYATIILPKFGPRRAKVWYWKQVVCSMWPLIRPRLKGLAILVGLCKTALRFSHFFEKA
jgi:hypothetical protein